MADRDPLRHIFDGLVDLPSPTSEQTESAHRSLQAAIREEPRPRIRPGRPAVVSIAAVLVLAVIFTVLAPWRGTPASALFSELAEATRSITAEEMPTGSYVYVESQMLAYTGGDVPVDGEIITIQLVKPWSTEAWWRGDTAEVVTTVGRPIFFDQETEDFYYSRGLDAADFVGETRTDLFTGMSNQADPSAWSTNPEQLAQQMREDVASDPEDLPDDVKMLYLADELLAPQLLASPDLRAALLDVVSTLDIEDRGLEGGRISASITYETYAYGTVTSEWVFDSDGYLVERRSTTLTGDVLTGLPPNTVFDWMQQAPPAVVPDRGVRP